MANIPNGVNAEGAMNAPNDDISKLIDSLLKIETSIGSIKLSYESELIRQRQKETVSFGKQPTVNDMIKFTNNLGVAVPAGFVMLHNDLLKMGASGEATGSGDSLQGALAKLAGAGAKFLGSLTVAGLGVALGTGLAIAAIPLGLGLATALVGAGAGLSLAFRGIGEGIGSALSGLGDFAEKLGRGLGSALSGLFSGIGELARGLGEGIGTAFLGLFSGVGELARGLGEGIGLALSGLFSGLGDLAEGIGRGFGAAMGATAEGIGKGVGAVLNGAGDAVEGIGKGVGSVLSGTGDAAEGIGKGIGSTLSGAGDLAKGIGEGLASVVFAGGDAIAAIVKGIGSGISEAFKGGGDAIATIIKALKSNVAIDAIFNDEESNNAIANDSEVFEIKKQGTASVLKAYFASLIDSFGYEISESDVKSGNLSNIKKKSGFGEWLKGIVSDVGGALGGLISGVFSGGKGSTGEIDLSGGLDPFTDSNVQRALYSGTAGVLTAYYNQMVEAIEDVPIGYGSDMRAWAKSSMESAFKSMGLKTSESIQSTTQVIQSNFDDTKIRVTITNLSTIVDDIRNKLNTIEIGQPLVVNNLNNNGSSPIMATEIPE